MGKFLLNRKQYETFNIYKLGKINFANYKNVI